MDMHVERPGLAERTAEKLRDLLKQGYWIDYLPGEYSLADSLGVSRSTLRSALAMLEEEGCLKAIRGRGRRILEQSHSLIPKQGPRRVGIILSAGLEDLPSGVLHYVSELYSHLQAQGYRLEVFSQRRFDSSAGKRLFEQWIADPGVAAWILHSIPHTAHLWAVHHELKALVSGTPRPEITLPSLDLDYRAVARHATGRLLAKGHRRIGLMLPRNPLGGDEEARIGFEEAIKPHLPEGGSALIMQMSSEPKSMRTSIERCLGGSQRPTAILLRSLSEALTLYGVAHDKRLFIPRDLSVLALNHTPEMDYFNPSLATYTMSKSKYAKYLARLVLQLIKQGRLSRQHHRLLAEFKPGGSFTRCSLNGPVNRAD